MRYGIQYEKANLRGLWVGTVQAPARKTLQIWDAAASGPRFRARAHSDPETLVDTDPQYASRAGAVAGTELRSVLATLPLRHPLRLSLDPFVKHEHSHAYDHDTINMSTGGIEPWPLDKEEELCLALDIGTTNCTHPGLIPDARADGMELSGRLHCSSHPRYDLRHGGYETAPLTPLQASLQRFALSTRCTRDTIVFVREC